MKWRIRKRGARYRALHQWHVWFAWYPVTVPTKGKNSGQTRVWLESVCRKGFYCKHLDPIDNHWVWEYKEVEIR